MATPSGSGITLLYINFINPNLIICWWQNANSYTASFDLVEHTLIVIKIINTCYDFMVLATLNLKISIFHTATLPQEGKFLLQSPQSCMPVLDDKYLQVVPSHYSWNLIEYHLTHRKIQDHVMHF